MNSIACWNVRGFNQPFKSKEVRNLIRENEIGLCCILETHVSKKKLNSVFTRLFRDWKWTSNSDLCFKGSRIVIGWDDSVFELMSMFSTDQVIHCLVSDKRSSVHFFCSFVYAANDHIPRRKLWHSIEVFSQLVGESPWMILGDFNATLHLEEIVGGVIGRSPAMEEFRECISKVEVMDLHFSGMRFTWSGSPQGVGVVKKLDRALVNGSFQTKFPLAKVRFLAPRTSDHSPIVVEINQGVVIRRKYAFKFQNFLTNRTNFLSLIQQSWNNQVGGVRMFRLVQKLKSLKPVLRHEAWAAGNLCNKVKELKDDLVSVQMARDCDPLNETVKREEARISRAYREAALEEERMLKQKSKIHWLNVGDQNNKFSHKSIQVKRNKNRISSILNGQGDRIEGESMVNHFISFYKDLLGTKSECTSIEGLSEMFDRKVPADMGAEMLKEVTREEIREVVFAMGDDKASGPDGYSAKFFKSAWTVIGEDFCKAVQEFFRSGKLLKEVNATLIALIPKVDSPERVGEFRPIALCNVVYKCISKILANRIKGSLDSIIDDNQNAFIPGRRISDNILLTQELLRNYHRDKGVPRCAFKVDIKKAYDSVNWDFLFEALYLFGFPERMIAWIRECVSTPSYSVIVNGEAVGFFKGEKGLRQGDPLSPYLFTIVMQVLSIILRKRIEEDGGFKFHRKCDIQKIAHLCFADDLFLFSHGDPWSVQILRDSLDEFGEASGLWPNESKSSMFFCNVPRDSRVIIKGIMKFEVGLLPVKYLGVPLISTRLWHADCVSLIDQVKSRIQSWQNRWLSFAGRLQLAVSVLSSMQVYWASVFILPVSVSKEIEKLIRNFIWSGVELVHGKAKVAWRDVCRPKQEGGLGIRPLTAWNKALMAFHIWSVVTNRQSLWVRWIHTYRLRGRSIWQIKIAWDASASWKRILNLRGEFRRFFKMEVGDGRRIFFWHDSWATDTPLSDRFTTREILSLGFSELDKVADFGVGGYVEWPHGVLLKWPELGGRVIRIQNFRLDRAVWVSRDGSLGPFQSSISWNDFREVHPVVEWFHLVWFSNLIPKHSFILWLAIRRKLLTQDRRQLWQVGDDDSCPFCKGQKDSVDHLFFKCFFPREVLRFFFRKGVIIPEEMTWDQIISFAAARWKGKGLVAIVNKLVLGSLIYFIWQERNLRLFQSQHRSLAQVIGLIHEAVRFKILNFKVKHNSRVEEIMKAWDVPLDLNSNKNGGRFLL